MQFKVIGIKEINSQSSLRAFADVEIDGVLVVKGCGIFEGRDGLFASFPSEKGKDGKYYPKVFIKKDAADLRQAFNAAVIQAYNEGVDPEVGGEPTPF